MGARTRGMFFHLCHSVASCAEPSGEFNSPSMHADCLAFYHLPDGAPVYQVLVDVPESCFSSPVCLHRFASHLLEKMVFQVCTDFFGSKENSPPFAVKLYGCSMSLCVILGPVCLSSHIHIDIPLLHNCEHLVFFILMSSDVLPGPCQQYVSYLQSCDLD